MIKKNKIVHFIYCSMSVNKFILPLMLSAINKGYHSVAIVCVEKFPIKEIPVTILHKNFRLTLNPIRLIRRFMHTRSLLKKLNPEMLHAHMTLTSTIPLLAAYFLHIKIRIYHNHGSLVSNNKSLLFPFFWMLEKINCSLATDVLFVNGDIRNEFARLKLIQKGTVLDAGSICGIDKTMYDTFPNAVKDYSVEPFQFLYVGRPHVRKGFDFLIQVWARYFANNKKIELVLAGCTKKDLQYYIASAPDNIRVLGFVNDMVPIYKNSDALVHPSFHEGFGYCILESLAAGIPCIVSDILGHQWAISNKAAVGTPVNDPQKFANAMLEIYQNEELRNAYIKRGYKLAEKYNQKIILSAYLNYLEKVHLGVENINKQIKDLKIL